MPFLWGRKRGGNRRGVTGKREAPKGIINLHKEITIPTHFRCPITLDLMKDPVSLSTGITYDRESIEKWIDEGHVTCPVSNQILRNFDQIPNHALRKMIQDWCVENKNHGVERIPTPRIPISPYDVSEFCSRILVSTRKGDEKTCREWLGKIKSLAKESERNKQCIVSNGIGSALANVLESFASISIDKHVNLLEEALSMLTWSFPLGREGISKLKSQASLNCIVWFLQGKSNDLPTIQNAIFVLKDLIFEDQSVVEVLMEIKGIETTLLHALRMPVGPKATQACLMLIHLMISQQEKNPTTTLRFVQIGLVPLILDILVDCNKSMCEKALGVLDGLCNLEEGKKSTSTNALTVPLVIKKILRVSDIATEFSISILWKIGFGENEEALIEAVQHGAFQKLLVVLQVGCGERSKEKTTELLRLMNRYRNKLDCFEASMGFKYVKKSNNC